MSRDEEIPEVMRRTNLHYPEAAALVARRYGEDVSDLTGPDGLLTDEQRCRLGLGRSLEDIAESTNPPPGNPRPGSDG
jgi:hypothetical protein